MSSWVSQGVLKGADGATGATGSTGPAGTSFTFRAAYNAGTAYVVNDIVSYTDGATYICILATTGHVPTNATYWTLFTAAGATGATGSAGSTGSTGAAGARGSLYLGFYANFAALPTIDGTTVIVGDMALTSDTSTFYRAT
jgi:hypothetical protein